MIHTMIIQHDMSLRQANNILMQQGYSYEDAIQFLHGEARRLDKDGFLQPVNSQVIQQIPIPGIEEMSIYLSGRHNKKARYSYWQPILYLRMEPLTLVTKEQHIRLFECTDENVRRLCQEFRNEMAVFLKLDGDPNNEMNGLAELPSWDATRIDYTKDIRMNNHDEVLTMMNLGKWLACVSGYMHAGECSTYGKHFSDESCKIYNKTWEIEIYDKQAQIENKRDVYAENVAVDVHQQLVNESKNILRIEYRRKNPGTKKGSTGFDNRNIMQFLSEEVGDAWFHQAYSSLYGYEPFYVLDYHLRKKLAEVFPLAKKEREAEARKKRRHDKELAKARSSRRKVAPYKEPLGKKAQKYWDYMTNIMSHKGLKNAWNASGQTKNAYLRYSKIIREEIGVCPVTIPRVWIYERELDIPHDFLPNPIRRPEYEERTGG